MDSEEVMLESKRNSGITIERKEVTQVSGSGNAVEALDMYSRN